MFCPKCGKKVGDHDSFCEFCGYNFLERGQIELGRERKDEPLMILNISKSEALFLYKSYLVYRGQRINYSDIEGISYLCTKTTHSVYFIPIEKSSRYSIQLQVAGKIHKIEFTSESFPFGKSKSEIEKDELFGRFCLIIEKLIKPFVLIGLLLRFAEEKQFKMPSLTINQNGLYRKGFWGKEEFLPWDQYYNAILKEGLLHIYKVDNKKKYREYFTCPMNIINSVVLPDFLNFLFQKKGVLDEKTKLELIRLKDELITKSKKQIAG
jgi:hypothetical protein